MSSETDTEVTMVPSGGVNLMALPIRLVSDLVKPLAVARDRGLAARSVALPVQAASRSRSGSPPSVRVDQSCRGRPARRSISIAVALQAGELEEVVDHADQRRRLGPDLCRTSASAGRQIAVLSSSMQVRAQRQRVERRAQVVRDDGVEVEAPRFGRRRSVTSRSAMVVLASSSDGQQAQRGREEPPADLDVGQAAARPCRRARPAWAARAREPARRAGRPSERLVRPLEHRARLLVDEA